MNKPIWTNTRSHPAKLLSIAILSTLPVFLLSAGSVLANDCSRATSLIQTPDGRCYNLDYLTRLGQSRQNVQDASGLYQEAIDINTPLPTTFITSTPVTRNSVTSVMTVDTYNPTTEERRENRDILRQASDHFQQRTATNEDTERWAFRKQQQVLKGVSGAFSNPLPINDYPDLPCYEICRW